MRHPLCFVFLAAMTTLALAACHPDRTSASDASNASNASKTLKMYSVPPARTQGLRSALFLGLNGSASVSSPTPGKLLVYATRDEQQSIGRVIETLVKSQPHAAPRQIVTVHFWVVDGIPGNGKDDAAMRMLSPALASLRHSLGPLHFRLDGTASMMTTVGGAWSMMTLNNGSSFKAKATDSPTSQIDMQVQFAGAKNPGANVAQALQTLQTVAHALQGGGNDEQLHELQTEVAVTPGQYIVLAQSANAHFTGLPGHGGPAPSGSTPTSTTGRAKADGMRLLIMRVTADKTSH